METAASFVGVGLEGCLVPLKSGMPALSNNAFLIGDLNVLTGLLGDGSTKSISTNYSPSSNQDDFSASIYVTGTPTAGYVFGASSFTGGNGIITDGRCRNQVSAQGTTSTAVAANGITGTSRASSAGYDWRINGSSGSFTVASETVPSRFLLLFCRNTDAEELPRTHSNPRIATYHAGPALNLATLESLQATLISEIAAI
jgi:hypothetical protein